MIGDKGDRNQVGALLAWAFALRRMVDVAVMDPAIDSSKIFGMGQSRNGKAALLTGAMDTLVALTISNGSGCALAALSRRKP